MRLAVIGAIGWARHREAATALVEAIRGSAGTACVVLDSSTIRAHRDIAPPPGAPAASVVPLAKWLKPGAVDDFILDIHTVRDTPFRLPLDRPVILDCAGYRAGLVEAAVSECRSAWYPLDSWHPAFAVVCEDALLLRLADRVSNTFYCQPMSFSEEELRAIVDAHMAKASVYRLFGYSAGRASRALRSRLRNLRVRLIQRVRDW